MAYQVLPDSVSEESFFGSITDETSIPKISSQDRAITDVSSKELNQENESLISIKKHINSLKLNSEDTSKKKSSSSIMRFFKRLFS